MTTNLKTRNGKGLSFTGSCTEILDIDSVVAHTANEKWRSNSEKFIDEQRDDLMESIRSQGLREPITMYENSQIIISGHTRTEMLRQLGAIQVPVQRLPRPEGMSKTGEIDPMDPLVIREHAISNTRVDLGVHGRYLYARELMSAWVEDFDPDEKASGQLTTKKKREILKIAGIGHLSFDTVERVRYGYNKEFKGKDYFVEARDDLYSDLANPKKDYTARQLGKLQLQDFRSANFTDFFPKQDFMDDALYDLNFDCILAKVKGHLDSIASLSAVEDTDWFALADDNYVSATIHHMICAFACQELNEKFEELGFEERAKLGNNQSHYDIYVKDRDGNEVSSIEVKTTNGRSNWSSGSNKSGYNLLFAYNNERDRFFAVSVYLGMDDWEGGVAGKFTLPCKTVYLKEEEETNIYIGDIELDNDTYRIQKNRLEGLSA